MALDVVANSEALNIDGAIPRSQGALVSSAVHAPSVVHYQDSTCKDASVGAARRQPRSFSNIAFCSSTLRRLLYSF